jgi:putative Ca2+/H+ antiporter (TMEM165/GDT1 family)
MDEKQDQKSKWVEMGVKLALAFAALFPVYALLYVTFPVSIVAIYFISAILFALFAPWDDLKKKFLS